uniref:Prenyl transferase n=1 Tax=Hildenbrandia rivularis TaxID=135206 RepID=A0A1C9CFF6_9FLOR|nr:prenyl transferase [Hildenbrandia rivularis]AOM67082.1 prenyl transferase [Hildenbrandia rivularis]
MIFTLPISSYLKILNLNLRTMIKARNPILYAAAEHLFSAGGKRIRPAIVFLVAQTTMNSKIILDNHKRLAEITEIIHTASLVHDDVLDDCATRRGVDSVHNTFNTKIAILAGDFLFAQSSWYLANLENLEAVKMISKVIIDFAEGEVQQNLTQFDLNISVFNYVEKSFYKTASLIAASCKAAAIISRVHKNVQNRIYTYGKHLGLAFQIIDDILDIISSDQTLGKPAGSDLRNGNLTAPILFALHEQPDIKLIIDRELHRRSDPTKVLNLIKNSSGIQQAIDIAQEHLQAAMYPLKFLHSSSSYISLIKLAEYIIKQISRQYILYLNTNSFRQ